MNAPQLASGLLAIPLTLCSASATLQDSYGLRLLDSFLPSEWSKPSHAALKDTRPKDAVLDLESTSLDPFLRVH